MKHLSLALIVMILVAGCRKANPGGNYSIIAPDTVKVGQSFHVSTSTYARSGYTYFWDLDDGITSTETSITRCFTVSKIYTIKLTINGDVVNTKSKQIFATPNYAFYAGGVHVKGDTVRYSLNYPQPVNSSFYWRFGDGTYSTDSIARHVYSDTGTYKVYLTVNGDTINTVMSKVRIYNDPLYTNQITGTKNWHGTHATNIYGNYRNSWSVNDTSLTIHDSDKITVYCMGFLNEHQVYQYEPALSQGDTLVYVNGSGKIKYNHTIGKAWWYFSYGEIPYF